MKIYLIIILSSLPLYSNPKIYNVILTAYCNCQHCCGWKYNSKGIPVFNYGKLKGKKKIIGKTASGKISKQGRTLAMPKKFPFGTKVYIGKKLLGICEDRGGAIIIKNNKIKIDVFMKSHEDALKFGIKKVKVLID